MQATRFQAVSDRELLTVTGGSVWRTLVDVARVSPGQVLGLLHLSSQLSVGRIAVVPLTAKRLLPARAHLAGLGAAISAV